jgi:hypothetical protein
VLTIPSTLVPAPPDAGSASAPSGNGEEPAVLLKGNAEKAVLHSKGLQCGSGGNPDKCWRIQARRGEQERIVNDGR